MNPRNVPAVLTRTSPPYPAWKSTPEPICREWVGQDKHRKRAIRRKAHVSPRDAPMGHAGKSKKAHKMDRV